MSETYLRSLSNPSKIKECIDTYGAVGVTDILTKEEILATRLEVETILKKLGCSDSFTLDDPYTYELASSYMNAHGTIGKEALFAPQLLKNRFHKNVKKAYSIAYGMDASKLLAQYDRLGWMRPVVGPNGEDWQKYSLPYFTPGIHLDVDPPSYFDDKQSQIVKDYLNQIPYSEKRHFISENNARNINHGRCLQGVLNLYDNEEENGGFHFIPKGHKIVNEWYDKKKGQFGKPVISGNYFFKSSDYDFLFPERIPCPAGTLIIFDCALPHGAQPNRTNQNRMIQFLRYMPKSFFNDQTLKRRRHLVINEAKKCGYHLNADDLEVV